VACHRIEAAQLGTLTRHVVKNCVDCGTMTRTPGEGIRQHVPNLIPGGYYETSRARIRAGLRVIGHCLKLGGRRHMDRIRDY